MTTYNFLSFGVFDKSGNFVNFVAPLLHGIFLRERNTPCDSVKRRFNTILTCVSNNMQKFNADVHRGIYNKMQDDHFIFFDIAWLSDN